MNGRARTTGFLSGRVGRRRWLRTPVAVLTVAVTVAAGMHLVGAQPVGNPGNINFKIVGGGVKLGNQIVDLTPKPLAECSDGENNDGDPQDPSAAQDLLIDFPADPQCTSASDNSEAASGFQPKQDATIAGTITGAGAVTVPTTGVFFPPTYVFAQGGVLTVQVVPKATSTGNVNPLTGVASLSLTLFLSITGTAGGFDLGASCGIGNFTVNPLITGTTNPPLPAEPISGAPYNPDTGQATVVNNSFSVPGASNCAPLGAANGPLSAAFGVPAPAGLNYMILQLESTPKIQKGVRASNVPSVTTGVAPLTVNFNGTGSAAAKPIASYAWDFGNGQTASGSTAFTTYTNPGTYQAKLTVTDTDGDTDVQIRTITVNAPPNQPPVANIAASGSGGLAPYTVSFNGSASNDPDGSIVSYAWDFGNGRTATTPTGSATYNSPGTYTVTLVVTDNRGATDTATRTIVVTGAPNIPPTAVIRTVSVSGSLPRTVTLSGSDSSDPDGSIVSYAWDLGNGQTAAGPSAQGVYTTEGTYTVTLTVTDDRGSTATQTLSIDVSAGSNLAPSANFTATPSTGAAPLSVSLDGSGSSDADGTIAGYAWNFGNGQNGSGATPPAVTYTIPGTYTVTLTVTDNRGGTNSLSRQVVVSPPPNQSPTATASATPSTGVAPLLVQLSSAGSADPDGAIVSYSWNLGNGQTSTSPNPSATYATAGTYSVSLTVTDNDGATAASSLTVEVLPPNQPPVPAIAASPINGAAPLGVAVNGAGSTDPDGSIVSYAWDFANGLNATGALASTVYSTPGTYQLRLTVTDNRGAVRSTTVTIVVGATNVRPVAVISALPTAGPAPLVVQLSSVGSNDPDGSIVSYAWDFGNGQSAVGPVTSVTYPTAGTYTVTLTVTDNRGGKGSTTEQVVVDPPQTPRDRVRLQLSGSVNYSYDGPLSSGGVTLTGDVFGVSAVGGTGGFGASGSTTVNLSRFLFFNAYIGTVGVSDPAVGLDQTVTVFFGALTRPSATSVRGSATGFDSNFAPFTFSYTYDDRI